MQEKLIKIPFSSQFFFKDHKILWAFSNQRRLISDLIYTALAVVCLIVGLIYEKNQDFPLATVFGGGYLFYMMLRWVGMLERKVRYFKKVKATALHYNEISLMSIYIFSDNGFEYQDQEKLFRLSWPLFKSMVIYKNNILLILKETGITFTIGREELGDAEYSDLCDSLKEKIGMIQVF